MPRCALVSLLAASLGACASAGGSGSGGECRSTLQADSIPLDASLDSAAASAGLSSAWDGVNGLTLGRIYYDSTGVFDRVSVISATLAEPTRNLFEDIVARAVHDRPSDRRVVRMLIGDETGLSLRSVGAFRSCRPAIDDPGEMTRRVQAESSALGLEIGMRLVVRLQVFVEADGSVGEVRFDRRSGNVLADIAANRVFEGARFRPARVEGIPVPVWVSFPVTFNRARGP